MESAFFMVAERASTQDARVLQTWSVQERSRNCLEQHAVFNTSSRPSRCSRRALLLGSSQELGRGEASRGGEFRGDTKKSEQSSLSSSGPLACLAGRTVASQPSLLRCLFWLGCIPCRTPWSALDSDPTETTEQCPISPSMHSPSLRVSELCTATVPEMPPVVVSKNSHHRKIFSARQHVLRGQILARCSSDHGGNQVVFHSLFLKGMSVFERVVRRLAKVRDWVLTFLLGHTIFPGGRRRRLWSGQEKRNTVSGLGKLRFAVFFHGASIAVFF